MAATKSRSLHHGPIRVEGNFELTDPEGKNFDLGGKTALYLCRCGQSANKPLCDGSHNKVGFTSEICARTL